MLDLIYLFGDLTMGDGLNDLSGGELLVSVVLCSYNPSGDVLAKTLASLSVQTLPIARWELILVDNNSDPPLSPNELLSFHPNARCVREPRQGKVFAMVRGIRAATADLMITVDDDSPLEADYLEIALRTHQAHPALGAFGAGTIIPLYESKPPQWFSEVSCLLAIRTLTSPVISRDMTGGRYRPWGLGLCITRSVAQAWVSWCECNLDSLLAVNSRKATGLEDDLFSMCAVRLGLCYGIFPDLRITHVIHSSRIDEGYLTELARDHGYSHAQLAVISGLSLQNPDPPASLKVATALLAGFRLHGARVECSRLLSQLAEPIVLRQVRRAKDSGWREAIRDYHSQGLIPWKAALVRHPTPHTVDLLRPQSRK